MALKFKKISIIGLGLIGTSILHAIKAKEEDELVTFAYDIKPRHREIVLQMKIATFVCDDIKEAVREADLVILAVPVGSMKIVANLMAPFLKKNTIVTDTGSTKGSVISDVNPYIPENVYFIPSHPLAGTEYSGPKSGFSSLFENRYWLIVHGKQTNETIKLNIPDKKSNHW